MALNIGSKFTVDSNECKLILLITFSTIDICLKSGQK